MKKTYSRPEVSYENFQLSQSIASGCEGIANFAEDMCSVTYKVFGAEAQLFTLSEVCRDNVPRKDDYVCYHAPSEANNVFSS